jgi:hypothetical protein
MANKNNTNNGTENKAIDMNSLTEEQREAMLRVFMEQQAQTTTESPKEETPKVDKETTEAPPTSEEVTGVNKPLITKEQVEAAKKAAKELEKDYKVQENNTTLGKIKKVGKWVLAITAAVASGVAIGKMTNSNDVPYEEEDDECNGSDAEFYDDNESEEE